MDKTALDLWEKIYKNEKISSVVEEKSSSLYDELRITAKKYPSNIAYTYKNVSVTYEDFLNSINDCAKSLKKLDVKEKDIVTICMPNVKEALIMYYAINMMGATSNIMHPLTGELEITSELKDTGSKVILTTNGIYNKIIKNLAETSIETIIISNDLDISIKSNIYNFIKEKINPVKRFQQMFFKIFDNINILSWNSFIDKLNKVDMIPYIKVHKESAASILYSGGANGYPKGVILSNLNLNNATTSFKNVIKITPKDKVLSSISFTQNFGLGGIVHAVFTTGATLNLSSKTNKNDLLNILITKRPSIIIGDIKFYKDLLSLELSKNALKSIKEAIVLGQHLKKEERDGINLFLKEHGSRTFIKEGYGLTETAGLVAITIKENKGLIPLPGTSIKIVKMGTHDASSFGEDGEICISSNSVMMGYFNNIRETMQAIREHHDKKAWLHTGDIASLEKDGSIIYKARIKSMIITDGYHTYPSYVEKIIDKHPAVYTSIVIGASKDGNDYVKAYIVLKSNYSPNADLIESLKRHCIKYLPVYSVPKEFEFKSDISLNLIKDITNQDFDKKL